MHELNEVSKALDLAERKLVTGERLPWSLNRLQELREAASELSELDMWRQEQLHNRCFPVGIPD